MREGDVEAVSAYVSAMPAADPVSSVTGGDAAKGKEIYTTICIACHGADGAGNQQMMGAAPIHRLSDWYLFRQVQNFRAGIRGARPGDQGGALMRPMITKLTGEQDIKDVIAYITTLAK
jgi:cytochrome c oxidase cbb3-type subunit 3